MKTVYIKHLAQLYTGFTIRESIDYLEYGEIKAIQIKDLPKESHQIDTSLLTCIDWKYDSKPQFLSHNTILLVARGKPSAYLFTGNIEDKVVASNPFIVINLTEDTLLPEYLVWYLNHSTDAKNYFSSISRGTSFLIFTLSVVKELPIKIPPLEIQQQIIDGYAQTLLEKKCVEKFIQLRQEYNTAFAEQLLNTNYGV